MMTDVSTILWKELSELMQSMRKPSSLMGLLFYLIFFGVFPVFLIGPLFASSPLAFFYWIILPVMVGTGVATNAFAGERERHTLETLLATRLPDQAILFGKLAASSLYSFLFVVLAMLFGLLPLNVIHRGDYLVAYTPAVAVGGLLLGGLVAAVMSVAGVLASLRAASVREAGQKLALIMMACFFPYFGMSFVPLEQRASIIQWLNGLNIWLFVLMVSLVLIVIFGVLLLLAMRQFRRTRLLLDPQPTIQTASIKKNKEKDEKAPFRHSSNINLPAPLTDILTMMWKEWKELRHSDGQNTSIRLIVVGLIVFGLVLPLQGGIEWVTSGGALFAWIIMPTILVMRTIADSFAGERERQSLETLLATRLSDRVVLFGKLLTPLLLAWSITQILILVSLITTNIAFGQGGIVFFHPSVVVSGMGFGFLLSVLLAATGVLLSLRATTVRQAQQTLSIVWIVLVVVYIVLTILTLVLLDYIGVDVQAWMESGSMIPLALSAGVILALLDVGMLVLVQRRFKRTKLLLV